MDSDSLLPRAGAMPDLRGMLATIAREMHECCADRWAVIGSAAAKLVGADVSVADIDLLVSGRDADLLTVRWATRRQRVDPDAEDRLFRSHFARYAFASWQVEVMGDLELRTGHGWQPVRVVDTVNIDLGDVGVSVPSRAEQLRLLDSFGRPKDVRRAAILRELVKG